MHPTYPETNERKGSGEDGDLTAIRKTSIEGVLAAKEPLSASDGFLASTIAFHFPSKQWYDALALERAPWMGFERVENAKKGGRHCNNVDNAAGGDPRIQAPLLSERETLLNDNNKEARYKGISKGVKKGRISIPDRACSVAAFFFSLG